MKVNRFKQFSHSDVVIACIDKFCEINIIEIFWRFMKYQWLESEAYESYSNLIKAVDKIIINFGTEYTINVV